VFDDQANWTVDPTRFVSKSQNTPFAGMELTGRVMRTIVGGKTVYSAA
jgi:dihydroorotase